MSSVAVLLCFVALCICLNADIVKQRELLRMPDAIDMTNASIIRVNPFAGPDVFDQFVVDIWRLGDVKLQPVQWNVSEWTGLAVPEGTHGEFQLGLSPGVTGSSAVQYFNGTFGAHLNTITNPIQPNQSLATITIEYNWSPETRVCPWANASHLELSVMYQAPAAARQGVAVYSSWSLGLLHAATRKFVWFETALFDLERPLGGDVVWLDSISGNAIVHSALNGQHSLFHTLLPDSAVSVSAPFSGLKLFHFTVSGDNIRAAMMAANSKFAGLNLSTVAAEWQLVHTNVEVEGTALGRCGHSLRLMNISRVFNEDE